MALSREEIATLARDAGFTGANIDVAVAVALAESGGNPYAHNGDSSTGDDSYGLWQINMIGSMGPDRRKRFNLSSNADLYDPETNARVAHSLWKSNGWSPWTTYTSGKYKKYMTNSVISASSSNGESSINPVVSIGDSINRFGENFLKGFASVGAVIVAVVLLALGVIILMRDKVTSVVPGGNIAKVAKVAKGVSS